MRKILGVIFFAIGLGELFAGNESAILCGVCVGVGLIMMFASKEE